PAAVIASGRAIVTTDLPNEPRHNPPQEWREALSVLGLGMVLPMIASGETIGVLYAGWRKDSPSARLAASEVAQVEMFASQAALALQQVEAQENRSRLFVLEDRDRIAGDLHDAVIQRLFAAGTRLHSAFGLSTRTEVRQRITEAIRELDQTTEEVRTAIFQLHDHMTDDAPSLRDRVVGEIEATNEMFGFTPRLVLHGRLEDLEPYKGRELVTIVREALNIAAKHGLPSRVEVVIRAGSDRLELDVVDDGHSNAGAEAELHEAALTHLATRVTRLGGSCHVRRTDGETTLEWRVR
ncbi:MAG TPA: GAF domain-containing protein, partial [Actinopolymorphaceae bacterium]|nr:GAF domain-containing protein [Actinopolymorphaceae bacterium]